MKDDELLAWIRCNKCKLAMKVKGNGSKPKMRQHLGEQGRSTCSGKTFTLEHDSSVEYGRAAHIELERRRKLWGRWTTPKRSPSETGSAWEGVRATSVRASRASVGSPGLGKRA